MDNRPFPDLRHIVRDAADERIDVFAEWVSSNTAVWNLLSCAESLPNHAKATAHVVAKHQAPVRGICKAHLVLLFYLLLSAMHADLCQIPTENC
jgi:hypothetical protein